MQSFRELGVWQKSIHLVTEIYKTTDSFPKSEVYGLASQMRRAAVSIPSNIAEGSVRGYRKEYVQFVGIAIGSAAELDTQLEIAQRLQYLDNERYTVLVESLREIMRMLMGLKKSLKSSVVS